MTSPLTEAAEEALATFKHHRALADLAMERFLSILSHGESIATGQASVPRCVRVWAEWLAENGPATRQTITDATDVKFTERGTPHTVLWDDLRGADVDVPPGTIVRFKGVRPQGRGAGPAIYALWSQRFDVLPLFGVGPNIRDAAPEPAAMTGVLGPTDHNFEDVYGSVAAEGVAPSDEVVNALRSGVAPQEVVDRIKASHGVMLAVEPPDLIDNHVGLDWPTDTEVTDD